MSVRVRTVALIGGECTGKTTLRNSIVQRLGGRGVHEYVREFVDTFGRTPRAPEQRAIMDRQIELEEAALLAARSAGESIVVADPAALMTAVYSIEYFADPSLIDLAISHQSAYDLTVWCQPDIPWVPDGDQRSGPEYRDSVNRIIADVVAEYDLKVLVVSGDTPSRLESVVDALNGA